MGCGDKSCGKWIHEECLKHYALMRVFDQLGKDQPHKSSRPDTGTAVKPESGKDEVKEPLSPKETGGAVSAQHSIDVKADTVEVGGKDEDEEEEAGGRRRTTAAAASSPSSSASGADGSKSAANGEAELTLRDRMTSRDALKREVTPTVTDSAISTGTKRTAAVAAAAAAEAAASSAAAAAAGATPRRGAGRPRKLQYWTLQSFEGKKKPYDRLFEAKLLLGPVESAPTMIEIRDLRTGVTGGDETWLEAAECPICGSRIG